MNERHVRIYLLENINLDEKYSMGELLLRHRNSSFVWTLVFLGLAYFYGVMASTANELTLIIFCILILLIPINVVISIKLHIRYLINFKSNTIVETENDDKNIFLSKIPNLSFGGLGVVLSIWASRNVSEEIIVIVGIFLLTFIIMLFTHFFSVYAYKFYLLKKYCPDLMKC